MHNINIYIEFDTGMLYSYTIKISGQILFSHTGGKETVIKTTWLFPKKWNIPSVSKIIWMQVFLS